MVIKIGNQKIWGGLNAITLLIVCSLAYYPITYTLNTLVNRYIQDGALWDTALCAGIYAMVVLNAMLLLLKRQTKLSIALLFFAIFVFSATIGLDLDGAEGAKGNIIPFFILYFPFTFVGVAIQDFKDLDKPIDIVTRIVTVAAVIWIAIVVFRINVGLRVAYMGISYYVLPSTLFRIYYYFRDHGYKNLIWMIANVMCQIIWGTRGPVLFMLLFVALCVIWNNRTKKGTFFAILLTFAGVIAYYYALEILIWANNIFTEMGLQNGGILKLLYDEDLSDGRIDLYSKVFPYISQNFIFGGGIYSDRVVIGEYTHLLPLELMCDFGAIMGSLMFLVLLMAIAKKAVIVKEFPDIKWALFWVTLMVGFIKLFVSGSYLEEPCFFLMLGLLANSHMEEIPEINTKT